MAIKDIFFLNLYLNAAITWKCTLVTYDGILESWHLNDQHYLNLVVETVKSLHKDIDAYVPNIKNSYYTWSLKHFSNMYQELSKPVGCKTTQKCHCQSEFGQRNNNGHICSSMEPNLSYSGDVQQGSVISSISPQAQPFTTFYHTPNIPMKESERILISNPSWFSEYKLK